MRKPNPDKCQLKWNKSRFGELCHMYSLNGKDIASIFPKETKDGRIQWGFWINRLSGHREINTDNCKDFVDEFKLNPTFPKRKEAKKKIEETVKVLLKANNGESV
jgi:hypothetical protein